MLNLKSIMDCLGKRKDKGIFSAEHQFQCELAKEIKSRYPNVTIRWEYQCDNIEGKIDLWIEDGRSVFAIEIQYKTAKLQCNGYELRDSCSMAKKPFFEDVKRLERIAERCVEHKRKFTGFVVILSNCSRLWNPTRQSHFTQLTDGSIIKGHINVRGDKLIEISGKYQLKWRKYYRANTRNGTFKYLLLKVYP
jgi:hypothetical protein